MNHYKAQKTEQGQSCVMSGRTLLATIQTEARSAEGDAEMIAVALNWLESEILAKNVTLCCECGRAFRADGDTADCEECRSADAAAVEHTATEPVGLLVDMLARIGPDGVLSDLAEACEAEGSTKSDAQNEVWCRLADDLRAFVDDQGDAGTWQDIDKAEVDADR